MKIALFSCVNPVKSGLADYTEELLPYFSKHFSIDLYIAPDLIPSSKEISQYCRVKTFVSEKFSPGDYSRIIYNFGNNYSPNKYIYQAMLKFPGIVIIHDYVLVGFYAEKYYSDKNSDALKTILKKYYHENGEKIAQEIITRAPVQIWETFRALDFPLNEEIISHSKGVVVHSNFIKNKILNKINIPIQVIPHHGHQEKSFDDLQTRKELGVKDDEILICSAGFINKNKRFETSIPAVKDLCNKKVKYLIIGKDDSGIIKRLLKKDKTNFIIKGFVKLETMEKYISAADICINLRYPTMGESSGSLLRMMGYKKPVIVSNCGSYSEFPDYSVIKINTDIYEKGMLTAHLRELINNPKLRIAIGSEAYDFVKNECSINKCTGKYAKFINSTF